MATEAIESESGFEPLVKGDLARVPLGFDLEGLVTNCYVDPLEPSVRTVSEERLSGVLVETLSL